MNLQTSIRSFAERKFKLTGIENYTFCLDGCVYKLSIYLDRLEILKKTPALKSIKPHIVYAKYSSSDEGNRICFFDELTDISVLEVGSRFNESNNLWARVYYVNLEGLAINSNPGLYMKIMRNKKFNQIIK